MAIPDFQSLMLPLLKFAADGKEHAAREATDSLSQLFQLSDEEKEQLLPSGQQTFIGNRVYWALTHLKHAGILESTRRGYFKISQRGLGVLQRNPSRIDLRFLSQFPEYLEFRRTTKKEKNGVVEVESELLNQRTPEELFEESYRSIRQELAQELLNQVHGQRARKGIFITTSDFSSNAREYVSNIDSKVVLIDGKQLAEFMIDHNVGVSKVSAYEIKKIDSDYFLEV